MSLTIINHPHETFTPSQSGALATVIWECCRAAQRSGSCPTVISRESPVPTFPWPELISIPYPRAEETGRLSWLWRAERKLTGWRHLRHRAYAVRVDRAIHSSKKTGPFLLNNDPEMAVFLRQRFPSAVIAHWFHNQMEASPRVREAYGRSVDVTLGISEFNGRWIREYYGLSEAHTVYNGIDLERFRPCHEKASGDLPIINFVGRTGIEKGPDILLEAALALAKRGLRFGLQVIGSNHFDRFVLDDYQRRLNALTAELEALNIAVRRPGHVGRAELPVELQKADIHVVPARWDEPFGLTTLEGMACGLATVASRTGGTPEIIGDAGLLFERENVVELADRLEPLICRKAVRSEVAARCRERAGAFTWDRTWRSLSTALSS